MLKAQTPVIFFLLFLQLLITLRALAKGDFYSESGDLHGVVSAMNRRLDNIKCVFSSN